MRVLVVGANGLLGSNVVRAGQQRDWTLSGTYHSNKPDFAVPLTQFDLENTAMFVDVLAEHNPDVVVNCAAMTDVDDCEQHLERAYRINGKAPGELAATSESFGADFVHISTDYVFDGTTQEPYKESLAPNPIQVYGESKLAGEKAVREAINETLIARLSFVWGVHRSTGELTGFPAWVLNQLRSGETVPLFTDQWVTPTRARQAAETLLDLIEHDATGLFHIACDSCVTPNRFGSVLAENIGAEDLIVEGSTDDIARDAERPTYSCLAVNKVESALQRPQPTLQKDIDAVAEFL